jgi:hypothetical protein
MPDQLVGDPVTGLFPVVFCALCWVVRTQHRCPTLVSSGGVRYGQEVVCGLAISGPSNVSYNDEEHITRCKEHTEEKENSRVQGQGSKVQGDKGRRVHSQRSFSAGSTLHQNFRECH